MGERVLNELLLLFVLTFFLRGDFSPSRLYVHFFRFYVSLNLSDNFSQPNTTTINCLLLLERTQLAKQGPAAVVMPVFIPMYSSGF